MPYFSFYTAEWGLLIAAAVVGMIAQWSLQHTFNKYSRVGSKKGISGAQAAQTILRAKNYSTAVRHVSGRLSDHFDPRTDTVNLSDSIYADTSIAALGVAAHECGHVMQQQEGYGPMKLRAAFVPIANIGSQLSMPLLLIGLLLGFTNLAYVGIALFFLAILFQVITLPVEFNASSRAIAVLQERGLIEHSEVPAVKKVLTAAAMTYVAAAVASFLQLFRFILMARSRRD